MNSAYNNAYTGHYNGNDTNLLLTTGNNFEGYVVERYIDVICVDVVFKNSYTNTISASLDALVDSFKNKETELSSFTKLIVNAREYVIKKLKIEQLKWAQMLFWALISRQLLVLIL